MTSSGFSCLGLLMFSIRTDGVNEHVIAILAKLGAANRTEAVATAVRKQLVRI